MPRSLSRAVLLRAAGNERLRSAVERVPVTDRLVARYVAGIDVDDALGVAGDLVADGLTATVQVLGERAHSRDQATRTTDAYVSLVTSLQRAALAAHTEVSLRLSAVGQALSADGWEMALENARRICQAARQAGTTVTLEMEDHTTTDSTLGILQQVRLDFPETGAVLQAALRRTEADCHELAYDGSRVRLCKGAYDEPAGVAYPHPRDVDQAFVRCARILLAGPGYPMLATHDSRLVEITGSLAAHYRREQRSYEYQMRYGVRTDRQRLLAQAGERVRVSVPYGADWYGYLVGRLAEHPADLFLFLRSVASKR